MRILGLWPGLALTNCRDSTSGAYNSVSADRTHNDDRGGGNNDNEKRADNAQSDAPSSATRTHTTSEELEPSETIAIDPLSQVRRHPSKTPGSMTNPPIGDGEIWSRTVLTLSPAYPKTDANRKVPSLQAEIADLLRTGFERRRKQA